MKAMRDSRINLFTMWFLGMLSYLAYMYFSYEIGNLQHIWKIDVTKISFLIIGLFTYSYSRLGVILYRSEKNYERLTSDKLTQGFLIGGWCTKLGLLGTIFGIIVMAGSFEGVDLSNINNVRTLFKTVMLGMSTALFTTVVGLIAEILLEVSYTIAGKDLDEKN